MMKVGARITAALAVAVLLAGVRAAAAADPPKWVATLYIEAQKSIGLRWTPVPGATGYKVLRSETAGSGYAEIATTSAPQHFDSAVEPGSTYYYVLQSVDASGVSGNSEERSVAIPGQKKVALVPPAWRSITANATTEFGKTTYKVALQWTKDPKVVAYNIYRSEVPGKDYQLVSSVPEDQFVDTTNLAEGKTYYYVLTGLDNAFQESKYSAEKSVKLEAAKKAEKRSVLPNPRLVVKASKELFRVSSGEGWSLGVPGDTAIDSEGNVYVADVVAAVIRVFDGKGEYLRQIGEKGPDTGRMMYPTGIGLDADDNLYVTDRGVKPRVVVYDSSGKFLREIIVPQPDEEYMKQFSDKAIQPVLRDVAVGTDGRMYIVDNALHRLVIADEDGKEFTTVGGPGDGLGEFNAPGWIMLNPETKEVHVTNGLNRRVEVFDLDGNALRSYGTSKSFIGSFVGATGIANYKDGGTIVVDSAAATVQFFDKEGTYLFSLGNEKAEVDAESKQRANWAIRSPGGISYDPGTGLIVFSLNQDHALMGRTMIE